MTGPVTFLAVGSRGDVEPLAVLAGAMVAGGSPATVVAVDEYAGLVRDSGARFRGLGSAMAEVERIGGSWLGRLAMHTPLAQPLLLRRWLGGLADALCEALDEVPERSLVVTGVASADAALALVEQRGCRMVTVLHTAVLPTAQRDSHLEGRRFSGRAGLDRALTRAYWAAVTGLSRVTATTFRSRHGLPRAGARSVAAADRHAVLLAADPVLIPPAPDWPRTVVQTAAIRPTDRPGRLLDEPLASFLTDGPPPVHVGVGSLNDAGGDRWLELIVAAARLSGRRVVTPAPPERDPSVIDGLVCTTRQVPHDALFPLLAGVVHHGGAGTCAAAMRAGVPSVAVPALFDQPYHALRLRALGVGPAPVPLAALTPARLAGLFCALGGGDYDRRAAEVGATARSIDGTAATMAQLLRLRGHE